MRNPGRRQWADYFDAITPNRVSGSDRYRRFLWLSASVCLFVLGLLAQQVEKPLSLEQVLQLLRGGDPSARVQYLVIEHGIDFSVSDQTEQDLKQAGASPELILLLRRLAPTKPAAASSASAKEQSTETQIYDFRFTMPPGWRRAGDAPGTRNSARLVPTNLPEGTAAILLFPGDELNGDLRSFFERKWADYKRGYVVTRELEVKSHRSRDGLLVVATCAALQDRNDGKTYNVCFHATQAGSRGEVDAVVLTNEAPQTIMQDFNAFSRSVKFSNAVAQETAGKPAITTSAEPKAATAGNSDEKLTSGKNTEQLVTYQGIRFAVPPGWKVGDPTKRPLFLTPPDLESGEQFSFGVMPPESLQGHSFSEYFASHWNAFAGRNATIIRQPRSFHIHGSESIEADADVEINKGQHVFLYFLALNGGDRAFGIVYTTNKGGLVKRYNEGTKLIVNSLTLNSGADSRESVGPPSTPSEQVRSGQTTLAPGMRDGVYVGFQRAAYSLHMEHRFLHLFPDGWVMLGIPEQGLDGFDFQSYRIQEQNKPFVGHYKVYGNRLDIIWLDSSDHRESHDLDDSSPDIHGPYYIPGCSVCNGTRFAGVYEWGGTLQFLPDGTFVDRGCIDQVLTIDLNHPRLGAGTYTVGNYSLTLNYQDGRYLRRSLVIGKNAEWIAISEIVLHRPGYQPMP